MTEQEKLLPGIERKEQACPFIEALRSLGTPGSKPVPRGRIQRILHKIWMRRPASWATVSKLAQSTIIMFQQEAEERHKMDMAIIENLNRTTVLVGQVVNKQNQKTPDDISIQ